jgi:hypothetical protein
LDELDFMVEQCNNLYVNDVIVITGDMSYLAISSFSGGYASGAPFSGHCAPRPPGGEREEEVILHPLFFP